MLPTPKKRTTFAKSLTVRSPASLLPIHSLNVGFQFTRLIGLFPSKTAAETAVRYVIPSRISIAFTYGMQLDTSW
jgi:hypothetical protein